jgi:GAF domain-containing protein
MQKYMQLNSFFERLSDESGTDNFITTFETNVRNLLDSRRILLWARVPSAKVIVSRTASVLVPEGEGLLGKVVNGGQRLMLTDPSRDPSYSMDHDGPLLSNARVSVYQPVVNSKKEVLWIIQIIDRLSPKGSVITPTGDDFLVLDFLALRLLKLYQEESRIDEMVKRILTESTRSLLIERQVMPLLETVQLTVTRIVGCESLQILFADAETRNLFQLTEAGAEAGQTSGVNLGQVRRVEIAVADAGIAGAAYTSKRSVNVAVAKEHPGFNREMDGEFGNGAVIAVPLLSSKGHVSLVAIARQKRNGVMFTDSDEIILEALSRVSQGALANAQSHERNIQEIQKALNNHKYYTALLAVAQELSAVLDTDTLVRKIMTKAQSFISADRCSLFLVDHVRGSIWSMLAHGTNERIYVPIGAGIAGTVVATGETLNIPDAYNDPRFNSAIDKSTGYRTRSILCVAIHSGRGDIIGCTQMINKLGATEFSATDVELITAFNVFCGIALSNAQLFETATQSKKKMTAMLDIALSLSSSATLDAIVTNIMGRAQELIEADFCWLFVNDRTRHVARPLAAKDEAATEFSLKQDAVGYVTVTGTELNLTNPNDDPRFDCFFSGLMKIEVKSMLVIPVIDAHGQIIGAVKAVNKKLVPKFTTEDQSLLRAFASFAGLALEQWLVKRPGDFGHAEINFFETLSPSELTSCELSDRMRIFDPLLSLINSQRFDVYTCTKNEEFRILAHFFEKYDLLQHFHITVGVLLHFLEAAYNEYNHIPFHNWNCAVSSTQLLFWEVTVLSEAVQWEKVELLALLVAGICHDCGRHHRSHVANEKAAFPLSLLYADSPVLESFHCASVIKLLSDPKCNILASMENEVVTEFWSLLIECILATDRAQHKKLLDEAEAKLRAGDGVYDTASRDGKLLLMKLLVKSATVAPVARALDLKAPWSSFLIEEALPKVSRSADQGLAAAIEELSPKGIAAAQMQFMDDFCVPLFETVAKVVEPLATVSESVRANLAIWRVFLEA